MNKVILSITAVAILPVLFLAQGQPRSWSAYGGGPEQIRYSSLRQINRTNVRQLEVAWTYDTGEMGGMQTQPVIVDGVLYAYTPTHKTFALQAATGKHLWTFDPMIVGRGPNRGVMYWAGGTDKRTGEYAWQIPLGEYPELAAKGISNTGTENYGGPIVTAGGLVFIAATNFDKKFRAFDKANGRLLWEGTLPFAGNATPVTFEADGRQFVVIAAGGGQARRVPSGGVYVAFVLPRGEEKKNE